MNTNKTLSLSRDLTNERISMPYPHVKILDPTDAVALILPELPTGELPVLCDLNGCTRQLASIKKSALVLRSLSNVTKLQYCISKTVSRDLTNTIDIMEVLA